MYKIAIIGDYDSICCFAALGIDIFPVRTFDEAEAALKKLAKSEYGIIYITEFYAENIYDAFVKFNENAVPAIIPVPSSQSSGNIGIRNIKTYAEKAIGSDMIFNDTI